MTASTHTMLVFRISICSSFLCVLLIIWFLYLFLRVRFVSNRLTPLLFVYDDRLFGCITRAFEPTQTSPPRPPPKKDVPLYHIRQTESDRVAGCWNTGLIGQKKGAFKIHSSSVRWAILARSILSLNLFLPFFFHSDLSPLLSLCMWLSFKAIAVSLLFSRRLCRVCSLWVKERRELIHFVVGSVVTRGSSFLLKRTREALWGERETATLSTDE